MIKEQGFKKAGIGLLVYAALIAAIAYLPFRLGYAVMGGFDHGPDMEEIVIMSIINWIAGILILAASAGIVAGMVALVKFAIKEISRGKHSKTFRGLENMGRKGFRTDCIGKEKIEAKRSR